MSKLDRQPASIHTRRKFLMKSAAVGGSLAAGGILAACGGSDSSTSSGSTGSTESEGGGGDLGAELKEILGTPKNLIKNGPGAFSMYGAFALTGQGSIYGKLQSEGFEFGAEHIEAWTDGKLKIQLNPLDNKSGDPQAGAAAARKAGLAKSPAFVTSYIFGFGSQPPLIEQYKMLTLDPGGGTGPLAKGVPYCYGFRASFPEDMTGGLVKTIMMQNPDVKTFALVDAEISPEYDGADKKSTEEVLKENGGELIFSTTAPLGATDYSSTISEVANAGADAVIFYTFGTDVGYQARELERQGVEGVFGGIDYTPDGTKIAGPAFKDWYFCIDFVNPEEPPSDWSELFVSTFEEAKGEAPEQYNAAYYSSAFAFAQMMDRILGEGGDLTKGEDFLKALESEPNFPTVYGGKGGEIGKIELNPETHTPNSIPMLCWKSKGTGETHDIEPLATCNIGGADYKSI